MAQGDKSSYTDKQKWQAAHLEKGYTRHGVPEAERRAWATVNKESGGGRKSGSVRGQAADKAPSDRGSRNGGLAPATRSAAQCSAAAKKAAATCRRDAAH
jgi:hypothetical protein